MSGKLGGGVTAVRGLLRGTDAINHQDSLRNLTANAGLLNVTMNVTLTQRAMEIEAPKIPDYIFFGVAITYALLFVIGIAGNVLVIFVVWRNRDMRNSTNLFLTNLSVSDLLVVMICMPSALLEFYSKDVWHLGEAMCRLVPYLESTVAHASILTIICVTTDRYFAICHPMKAQYLVTGGRTVKVIAAVWLFALTATSPHLALSYTENAEFYDGSLVVVCRIAIDTSIKEAYVFGMISVFFVIPFFVLAVLYTNIVVRLRTDKSELFRQDPAGKPTAIMRSRRQVVYMLISIIIVFFVCLLPMRALTLFFVYGSTEQKQNLSLEAYLNLLNFSRILFYLNSVINPILYNILSSRFRESFKRAISREYRMASLRTVTVSTAQSGRVTSTGSHPRHSRDSFQLKFKSTKKPGCLITNEVQDPTRPKSMHLSHSSSSGENNIMLKETLVVHNNHDNTSMSKCESTYC